MTKCPLLAILVAVIAAGLAACRPRPPAASEPLAPPSPALVAVARSHTAFGLDLFAQVRGRPGNLVMSPTSIATGLTQTWGGARGETAAQMAKVLHLDGAAAPDHRAVAAQARDLEARARHTRAQLALADRLWVSRDVPLIGSFGALLRQTYDAPLETLDFKGDATAARATINRWVAQRTDGKVTELVPSGVPDQWDAVILTDAVYFKGQWAQRFDRDATSRQPFFVARDKQVETPLMSLTGSHRYAALDDLQVLELPYVGDELVLVVLLPRARDGLPALEAQLNAASLERWLGALATRKVRVRLPRFTVKPSPLELVPALGSLGMKLATTQAADFTGIAPTRPLYVRKVFHGGFLEVNEEGTEAAAATAVVVTTKSAAPRLPTFRADHPFLFLVRARASGEVLFLGRLANPAEGAPIVDAAPPTASAAGDEHGPGWEKRARDSAAARIARARGEAEKVGVLSRLRGDGGLPQVSAGDAAPRGRR